MKTRAEADRDTKAAIQRTIREVNRLTKQRKRASGKERKDIDQQIKDYRFAVSKLQQSMRD